MEGSININESKLEALKQRLTQAGIDISKWGIGEAKTLAHLQKEITEGESVLVVDSGGKLLRKVIASGADVFYISPSGKKFRLKEEKQIFNDGRERQRIFEWSISEKIKVNENPKDGIIRGIHEELGINGELNLTEDGTYEPHSETAPQSYPGLQSEYTSYRFKLILKDEQYKPEGYVEEQQDKTTYFVWEEIK